MSRRLAAFRDSVDRTLESALAGLLGLMVAVVLWQVFTRFVLRSPSSGTEELVRFALLWLSLLGASYGFGRRAHLAIDLLPSALPTRHRRMHRVFAAGAVAAFAASVLILGGGRLARLTLSLGQASASLALERGYVYLVLPLSGALICFYAIADAASVGDEDSEG